MDWVHETHRNIYTRVDGKWARHPASVRALAALLLVYVDDDGCVYLATGESPADAITRVVQAHASERKRIAADVAALLESKPNDPPYLVHDEPEGCVRIRNFHAAQGVVPQSAEERSADRANDARSAAARRQQKYRDARLAKVCDQYGWECHWCGRKDTKLTIDHLTPRSRGGGDEIENLRPCCKPCNSRKKDMTEEEHDAWLVERANRNNVTPPNRNDVTQGQRNNVTQENRNALAGASAGVRTAARVPSVPSVPSNKPSNTDPDQRDLTGSDRACADSARIPGTAGIGVRS
jgi:5-methylcytosine-specific restriction endonuclease McrA